MNSFFYKSLKVFALPIALTVVLAGCSAEAKTNKETVATVNGEKISQEELTETLMTQYGVAALDTLITNKIFEMEAESEGLSVAEKEIQSELTELIETYGDQEEYEAVLDANNIEEEALLEDITTHLLQTKVLEKVINITDEELATYFEENKTTYEQTEQVEASHILVADEATAKEVINKLNEGSDFAELASEYSTDTSSSTAGGSLGYFGAGEMVEEFESVAFEMEIDDISDPVESEYGFHIIKVTGKQDAKEAVFEDVKEEVYDNLLEMRIQAEYSSWLTEKYAEYDIDNSLTE
ncbi:peptidylprolyl isomerase [Psychrobacillus psychrodurans]|uniref:peptidylprolyl isomerase n=1 Tax=Psychrobacillus psychrodurans TaxID=126157 RepID=UPI0008F1A0FE|nr:peptidylprolyl isomerase [Psychrobacillus psychrodurans]MCZ8542214.1 peptidylprolyl isomerase [Psychrobacillus psychrodurans]SFN19339.1 foldase protein PrsA [Psychrobacillus psychrodurans]